MGGGIVSLPGRSMCAIIVVSVVTAVSVVVSVSVVAGGSVVADVPAAADMSVVAAVFASFGVDMGIKRWPGWAIEALRKHDTHR